MKKDTIYFLTENRGWRNQYYEDCQNGFHSI